MVSVTGVDVVPEHVGFTTVIAAVPALAMRMAGTVAVSCVKETYVVANAVPFQLTVDVERKFVPFTVNVNCPPPAVAQVGLSEPIAGTAPIVNVRGPVPVPLALVALRVMIYVPTTVGVPEINPVVFT